MTYVILCLQSLTFNGREREREKGVCVCAGMGVGLRIGFLKSVKSNIDGKNVCYIG
jgi:hypothetical protein